MAQVDTSFIDRIVEMSASTVLYRQQLTEKMVEAELQAVAEEQRGAYYRRLLQTAREPGPEVDTESLERSLNAIVDEGKALTRQFGALYDEFSRVALRSAGSMYVTEKPVWIETSQQFSNRSVLNLAIFVFVATVLLTVGYLVLRDRWKLVVH